MGSDSRRSGGGGYGGGDNVQGGGGGGLSIPAADKKIVQNLKEIVGKNCTEAEIYVVLLECNMDADEAVHRLLSQDTFHEVKSKRERRKEGKETQEPRSRSNNGVSSKGARLGTEYVAGRTGVMENNYNDAEIGKCFYKRESGSVIPSLSSSSYVSSYVYRATGKILNEKTLPNSESYADNGRQLAGVGDTYTLSVQPSSGFQSSGVSNEHVSLADIVKRGGSQNIGSQMSGDASYTHQSGSSNFSHSATKSSQISSATDAEIHQDFQSPYHYNVPETVTESGVASGHQSFDNQWSKMEQVADAEGYFDQSGLRSDRVNLYRNSVSEEFQVRADNRVNINYDGSNSAASGQIVVNSSKGASIDGWPNEIGSSVSNGHMHKHHLEGSRNSREVPFTAHPASLEDNVLSVTANLQQLHIRKEETAKRSIEDSSSLVLPDHLQAFAADCSHLSFGTYKSGVPSSVPTSSCPSKSDVEVYAVDGASALRQDIRNSGYQDHELLGFQKVVLDSRNITSQPELLRSDVPVTTHEDQYMTLTSRLPEPSDRNVQLGSNFSDMIDPNAKNVLSANEMLMYSKPIPNDLFDLPVQSLRSQESPQFVATHNVPSRYGHALSSMNGPISMPEDLPSTNLIQGNILPQLLPMHPYSKPDHLSLEKIANLGGYGSMPQNQTNVPSTLSQSFPVEGPHHDSLGSSNYNFSRYRTGAAINNMHLSDGGDPGYGSIRRNSNNLPGSFLHNMSSSHSVAGATYNDLLRSQFNDGSVISHQQNNNFPTWDSGYASRSTTVHPESLYYNNLLGQNVQQQHPLYRQGQQPTPQYESLDQYSRTYSSRTGIGRDHPQQNFADSSLTDFQGTTANQMNRIWGHNF